MLAGKSVAFYFSGSFAVLASLVDSFVDILSQGVITYTSSRVNHHDPAYPVGKARLEVRMQPKKFRSKITLPSVSQL